MVAEEGTPMSDEPRLETLLIGIDAGCLSVFDRLFDEERIPAIERICTEGTCTPLRSQIPPWTPSAWPSLYTGVNPGKHGVMGFVGYEGYDWHVVSHNDVRKPSLWELLSHHGMTSVVVNVPVTHPPRPFDGALIPGFIGPEDPECHPSGLLEDVRSAIGEYRVYPRYTRDSERLSGNEKMAEYETLIGMRGAAFRHLVNDYTPEFGFLQFQKTDTVFHEFDGEETKVNRVYEAVDAEIEAILDACRPRRVVLASDHGIGTYGRYEFRVNEFLRREGYVQATNSGKGMPSWNPIRMELREGNRVSTWEPSRTERLAAGAAKFGLTARRARIVLEKLRLLGVVKRVVPSNVARTANVQVDFERSTAYMRTRTELGVRLNLAGREPNGVVDRSAYESVRAQLIDLLADVETPDGEPVFADVCPREEYIDGDVADDAVDIVTVPTDMNHFLSEQLGDDLFGLPEASWDHKLDGVFAAYGEGVDTDVHIEGAHLLDVAPTLLAAHGVPYSDRMDGAVLPIVDDPGSESYPARLGDAGDTGEVDDDVEERLADLGYL